MDWDLDWLDLEELGLPREKEPSDDEFSRPDPDGHDAGPDAEDGEAKPPADGAERPAEDPAAGGAPSIDDDSPATPADEMESEPSEPVPPGQDGTLTLKDGVVTVTPPVGDGRPPILRPEAGCHAWVNGEPVQDARAIYPEDEVRVEAAQEPSMTEIRVHLSQDQYTAFISVHMRAGVRYRLADQGPAYQLTVRAQRVGPAPLDIPTVKQLRTALDNEDVVYGISSEALQQIVTTCREDPTKAQEPVPVAFGVPAEPSVDERVELKFPTDARIRVESDDNTVDLLGLFQVPTVQSGDVLAVLHPGRRGRPGRTVTGRDVPVTDPRPAHIQAGEGAAWHAEKRKFTATRAGRPSRAGHILAVHNIHVVQGDLDAKDGHVDFPGDVEVMGSVNESIRVRATGSVVVRNNVSNALVEADEEVVVGRGVTRSKVVAGARYAGLIEPIALLRPLAHQLSRLLRAVEAAKADPRLRMEGRPPIPDGRLIKMLIERRFARIPKHVQQVVQFLRERSAKGLEGGFVQFIYMLEERLLGLGPVSLKDAGQVQELLDRCNKYIDAFFDEEQEPQGQTFDVAVRHLQNAEVRASGRIVFQSRGGSYYSQLYAGHGVAMEIGAFRGDAIKTLRGNVVLSEVGSPLGAPVTIHILTEGAFQARRVHPGVEVTIGNLTHRFDREARNVHVRSVDGVLQVF